MSVFTEQMKKVYIVMLDNLLKNADVEYAKNITDPYLTADSFYRLIRPIENIERYNGATKGVIIMPDVPVAFKCPFGKQTKINCFGSEEDIEFCCDYCAEECKNYKKSEEEGIAFFFAETTFLTTFEIGNIVLDVYIQELARPFEDYGSTTSFSEERIDKACSCLNSFESSLYDVDPAWMADFIDSYGEIDANILDVFLTDHAINDIHNGNIGYVDGRPVIFDYSGYYD